MVSFTALFTSFLLFAFVLSFPINGPDSLLVFSPHITSPRKGAKWPIGSVQNITWETSNIPAEKHNSTTQILLGYIADNSENLNVRHPLATGCRLMAGVATVTVPDVGSREDYVVVLFGDSGNVSPQFTITTLQSSIPHRLNHTF